MEPSDLAIEILKGIRDEVRGTNQRLDATNERLDATNERLDTMNADLGGRLERLEKRQVESEVRIATELVALNGTMNKVREAFLQDRSMRTRVADLERRVGAIEKRSG